MLKYEWKFVVVFFVYDRECGRINLHIYCQTRSEWKIVFHWNVNLVNENSSIFTKEMDEFVHSISPSYGITLEYRFLGGATQKNGLLLCFAQKGNRNMLILFLTPSIQVIWSPMAHEWQEHNNVWVMASYWVVKTKIHSCLEIDKFI